MSKMLVLERGEEHGEQQDVLLSEMIKSIGAWKILLIFFSSRKRKVQWNWRDINWKLGLAFTCFFLFLFAISGPQCLLLHPTDSTKLQVLFSLFFFLLLLLHPFWGCWDVWELDHNQATVKKKSNQMSLQTDFLAWFMGMNRNGTLLSMKATEIVIASIDVFIESIRRESYTIFFIGLSQINNK